MAVEGKTQEQIAKALDIAHQTVSKVLDALTKNGSAAKIGKPPPEIPDLFAADPEGIDGEQSISITSIIEPSLTLDNNPRALH